MPKVKISKGLLNEARSDWRNMYNNDKIKILNYLNSKQAGGAKVIDSVKNFGNKLKNNNIITKLQSNNKTVKIVLIILSVILCIFLVILGYGLFRQRVRKDKEYKDLNIVDLIKKSVEDIIESMFGTVKNVGLNVKQIAETKEVYNLGKNHYTYEEADKACSVLGGRLATRDEVKAAWNKGAEWCNYGWSAGGEALFPTQEKTYNLLKNAGREGECGVPGINGGNFKNKDMKLGANCYGVKPKPNSENILKVNCSDPKVTQLLDITTGQFGIKYSCIPESGPSADLRTESVMKTINPYNNYTWSKESKSNNLYVGNNSLARNGLKYETFGVREDFKPMFSKEVLQVAFKKILTYLKDTDSNSSLEKDALRVINGKLIYKDKDKKKISKLALNKIMSILKKYNIPLDNDTIDTAIEYYDNSIVNNLKRDIDYILTPSGIQAKYRKYLIKLKNSKSLPA